MGTIRCENCGAEVFLPEHSRLIKGVTFSEDSKGDYILHMKRDEKGRFVSNKTTEYGKENNANVNVKENETMMNNNNNGANNNNNINGGMNMNGFDMNALAAMVAQMVKNEMGSNAKAESSECEPEFKTLPTIDSVDGGRWAKNSKYYGKEICGYVFNSYMFPWHVVRQFRELMEQSKGDDYNVHGLIANNYPYMYSINFTMEMIRKLAMLNKKDRLAYDEAYRIFTLDSCKKIMADYIRNVIADLEKEERELARTNKIGKEVYIYRKKYGRITAGVVCEAIENHKVVRKIARNIELETVYTDLKRILNQLTERYAIYSYKDLYELMRDNVKIKVEAKRTKSKAFMDCFIKRGAYYTLKADIAFEDSTFRNLKGRDAIIELRRELNRDVAGYQIYAMLKEAKGIKCGNYRY